MVSSEYAYIPELGRVALVTHATLALLMGSDDQWDRYIAKQRAACELFAAGEEEAALLALRVQW